MERNTTGSPWSVGHLAAGPSTHQPAVLQMTTDASEQNNTDPLGGPVITRTMWFQHSMNMYVCQLTP